MDHHARPPDLNETKWEASITASLRASSDEQYQFGQEVWEAYLLDCDNDIIYDQTNTFGTLIIRERGYVRHNRHTNLSGTDLKGARRLYAEARKLGFYI